NRRLCDWTVPDQGRRRAGVSSFGFGGTNAHVVLEEAPDARPSGPSRAWQIVALSAQTSTSLDGATAHLAEFFGRHPEVNLADAAYTLKVGRRAFRQRRIVVAKTTGDAARALDTRDQRIVFDGSHDGPSRPIVFLFPGQGAQYAGMGRELYEQEPAFREAVDECAVKLTPHAGVDLRDLLYPQGAPDNARLTRTSIAQPALFVV